MSLGKTSLRQLRKLQVKQKRGVGLGHKRKEFEETGNTERAGDTARRTISAESRNKVLVGELQPILRRGIITATNPLHKRAVKGNPEERNHNCNQSSP